MKLTAAEKVARRRRRQWRVVRYYLDEYHLELYSRCDHGGTMESQIPTAALLRALQHTGLLRQWDRKQELLHRVK